MKSAEKRDDAVAACRVPRELDRGFDRFCPGVAKKGPDAA